MDVRIISLIGCIRGGARNVTRAAEKLRGAMPTALGLKRWAWHPSAAKKIAACAGRLRMEPLFLCAHLIARHVMSSQGSVTRWLTALKGGDEAASQALWERYHRQLVTLAKKKLGAAPRREADEEDVVQNAFRSFFRGVAGGRFPELHDRDNLWRLLVVITARKALKQIARECAQRRRGTTSAGETR